MVCRASGKAAGACGANKGDERYRSFRIDGRGKNDVDSYIAFVKPAIRKLVKEQVKALLAAKVQMHLWVMWDKEEVAVFEEERTTHEVKVEKVFNSAMPELFQGSQVD